MSENPYLPDDLDPEELPAEETDSAGRPGCFSPNVMALFFLVLTGLFLVYFFVLLVNPYVPVNLYPPRTPLPIYVVATADPDGPTIVPTATKLAGTVYFSTVAPSTTSTLAVTAAPLTSDTPVVVAPPRVATATVLPPSPTFISAPDNGDSAVGAFTPPPPVDLAQVTRAPFPFTVNGAGAIYVANPNDQGCRWASIAGTVVDLAGEEVPGLAIHVVGEGIDEIRFTGTALTYGVGGYEVFLNGAPLAGEYVMQLLSQTGAPISAEFSLLTIPTCEENVALVNFVQNHDY